MRYRVFVLAAIAAALFLSNDVRAGLWRRAGTVRVDSVSSLPGGLGRLPALPDDPENPITPAKAELGRLLFRLDLTEREKSDLEAFLVSLTGTVEKMETQTAAK